MAIELSMRAIAVGKPTKVGGCFEIESVARMNFETGLRRKLSGSLQPQQLILRRRAIAGKPRFAILAGMQFNDGRRNP